MMKKEKQTYAVKIAHKLSHNEEEIEIIQYGLHQAFLILLNILTLVICGVLWKELTFTLLMFLDIFFLRSYAGGYHADTELSCYLISTAIMNAAIWTKKILLPSNIILIVIWISTMIFIWIYTPVENPMHPLDENEQRKYAKNTRMILLCNGIILLAGIFMQQQLFMKVIVWVQVLIVTAMAAGIWKYKYTTHRSKKGSCILF